MKKRIGLVLGVTAGLLAAEAAAQAQEAARKFDMTCRYRDQRLMGDPNAAIGFLAPQIEEPVKIRVDLDAGKFCMDTCGATFSIATVAPQGILLETRKVDLPEATTLTVNQVLDPARKVFTVAQASVRGGKPYGAAQYTYACTQGAFSGLK